MLFAILVRASVLLAANRVHSFIEFLPLPTVTIFDLQFWLSIHSLCACRKHLIDMSRSSSSAELALPDAKRLSSLQAFGRHTKSATIDMLMQLQAAGALAGNDSKRTTVTTRATYFIVS